MTNLRVIDGIGNKQDYETEFIPRVGERFTLVYGISGEPIKTHYFRVKDVEYQFDSTSTAQVGILVEEENNPKYWPS